MTLFSNEPMSVDKYQQETAYIFNSMTNVDAGEALIYLLMGLHESVQNIEKTMKNYLQHREIDHSKLLSALGDVFLHACAIATKYNWKASDVLKISYNKLLLQKTTGVQ